MDNNIELPLINKQAITIVTASSNLYSPYLSVYLESIIQNTSPNNIYDIVILHNSITAENQKILLSMVENKENISLRFFNPEAIYGQYRELIAKKYKAQNQYVNIESLYRLLVPIIFAQYEKVIFTDLDLIFMADPAELYFWDMQEKPMWSCLEPVWSGFININFTQNGKFNILEYSLNTLNLQDPKRYFNTGVALYNIPVIRKKYGANLLIETITNNKEYLHQDQDVLNEIFNTDIGILPFEWNYELISDREIKEADAIFEHYGEIKNPKVIHYFARHKPWNTETTTFRHHPWWQYARNTPYYEQMLTDRCIKKAKDITDNISNKLHSIGKELQNL